MEGPIPGSVSIASCDALLISIRCGGSAAKAMAAKPSATKKEIRRMRLFLTISRGKKALFECAAKPEAGPGDLLFRNGADGQSSTARCAGSTASNDIRNRTEVFPALRIL